ncbi:MAG: hypothetical protein Q7S18_00365 [bacterium]|nr:hypothetical protein [bacterium]
MFVHLKSILYALIFLLSLEGIFSNGNLIRYVLVFLVLFSLFAARRIGGKNVFAVVPIVFSLSSIILIYLIDLSFEKQIFIVLSSIVFYFILLGIYRLKSYHKDKTAKGIFAGGLIFTVFFFYAGFYGLYLNFSIPLWFLMFIFLAITFILSYHYFSIISPGNKKTLSYSLILGMAMAQISWVINFWPFGYLTTGVIALIFYYVFWDITECYFLNKLSKRRVAKNLIFFSLLIGLILVSSRWQLAV